jgi:hypothetical protein
LNGGGRSLAALILLLGAISCATHRSDILLQPPRLVPYSASLRLTTTMGSRGITASGGCAVDPARGIRVELRSPSGSTLLLLLLHRDRALLIAPTRSISCGWTQATKDLPWSSADLWFLFTGDRPDGLTSLRMDERGLSQARWRGPLGALSGRFQPGETGISPFGSASVEGPSLSRLVLRFTSPQRAELPDSAFSPPPNLALVEASASEVLTAGSP